MADKPQFIHLNAHSSFSLLEGIPHVKALSKAAAEMGMPALGVTDKDNLFGAVEMSKYPAENGVQPIIGTQLSITRGKDERGNWLAPDKVTLLVQNEQGWKNIVELSSTAFLETENEGVPQLKLEELLSHSEGLILLTGGARISPVARHILQGNTSEAKTLLETLAKAFSGRLYVELQRHGWPEEEKAEEPLIELAYALNLPLVATNDARFLKKSQYNAFTAMLAIGDGITLNDKPIREFTPEHYLKTAEEMCQLFADIPEATQNTVEIAKRCAYQVPTGINYMPAWRWHAAPGELDGLPPANEVENPPTEAEVDEILIKESEKGLEQRLQDFVYTDEMSEEEKAAKHKEYFDRLKMEIGVITQMGYAGYFLITSDFITWSKKNDIPVGPGRGSGAGSVVAWALKITDVDPIVWDLYFERFLNPERVSLPDFDIDFCQERRDEVIHYVKERYGAACVSQIITFGTLKARACIRDVGRVLGLGFGQVGQIVAFIPEGPASIPIAEALDTDERLKEIYDTDDDIKQLLDVAMEIEGCYRHASTHAAGMIIADRSITDVCPMYKDPRSDMPATQFTMFDAEYAGLVKFDFLGLKTLTTIQYATKMMAEKGVIKEMIKVPLTDEPTYEMLRAGQTTGVFQVESQGMTDCLKKMVPDKMQYLSDVIALYRPGPLGSGMVEDFIDCRHGRKEPHYPHPILEPVLKDTFGVPVYQEQVMRMAQELAGYTLGGADILRRAMGKKKPAEMAKQREIFVEGAKQNDVDTRKANEIFDLMANFASYGFNKAHTIAYALIAYQTAWIKANHPLEFMAASMTMDRGNSDKVLKFKQELDRMKVELLPPDVNKSQLIFRVEENKAVRFALGAIKGAGDEAMKALVKEREENGPYVDIFDFMERQDPHYMNRRQLESLIKAGAFDTLEPNRHFLMENVDILLAHLHATFEDKNSNQIGLFGEASESSLSRPVLDGTMPWDLFETLENEQMAIGFYLSAHPLDSYKDELPKVGKLVNLTELEEIAGKQPKNVKVAALVMGKRELKTKKGDRMAIVTLSDLSGAAEVAMFPESYAANADLIQKNQAVLCSLNVNHDGERLRVNVESMIDLDKALTRQEKILLKVGSMDSVQKLKEMLEGQEAGQTMCELFYTVPNLGHAHVKLNKGIQANKRFMAQLDTLPDVVVFH